VYFIDVTTYCCLLWANEDVVYLCAWLEAENDGYGSVQQWDACEKELACCADETAQTQRQSASAAPPAEWA